MNETRSVAPERFQGRLEKLVAGEVVGHDIAQMQALRRSVLDVAHVEIEPAAIEQETAVAGRFLVVAIMQVDRARAHALRKR